MKSSETFGKELQVQQLIKQKARTSAMQELHNKEKAEGEKLLKKETEDSLTALVPLWYKQNEWINLRKAECENAKKKRRVGADQAASS